MIAVQIIYYNHRKVQLGEILCVVGVALLLLNAIPFLWENFGMAITYLGLLIIFLGLGYIHYYTHKTTEVGKILIEEDKTTIITETGQSDIINKDYFAEYSGDGFKGETSLISYLQFGSLFPKTGINTIKFFNEKAILKYDVLIATENQLFNLKKALPIFFKK